MSKQKTNVVSVESIVSAQTSPTRKPGADKRVTASADVTEMLQAQKEHNRLNLTERAQMACEHFAEREEVKQNWLPQIAEDGQVILDFKRIYTDTKVFGAKMNEHFPDVSVNDRRIAMKLAEYYDKIMDLRERSAYEPNLYEDMCEAKGVKPIKSHSFQSSNPQVLVETYRKCAPVEDDGAPVENRSPRTPTGESAGEAESQNCESTERMTKETLFANIRTAVDTQICTPDDLLAYVKTLPKLGKSKSK